MTAFIKKERDLKNPTPLVHNPYGGGSMKIIAVVIVCFTLGMVLEAQTSHPPTVAEAQAFMNKAEARLAELSVKVNQANWVHENFITDDTEAIAADANDELTAVTTELVEQSEALRGIEAAAGSRAQVPAAEAFADRACAEGSGAAQGDDADRGLARLGLRQRESIVRRPDKTVSTSPTIENIMGESRDPNELKEVWLGWHSIGAPMRQRYARFVDLSNQGARELGFKDTGVLWRAGYDMPPDQFSAEVDRLWEQVRPLYLSLYTYVRARLSQKYGAADCSAGWPDSRASCWAIPGRRPGETFSRFSGCRKTAAATT